MFRRGAGPLGGQSPRDEDFGSFKRQRIDGSGRYGGLSRDGIPVRRSFGGGFETARTDFERDRPLPLRIPRRWDDSADRLESYTPSSRPASRTTSPHQFSGEQQALRTSASSQNLAEQQQGLEEGEIATNEDRHYSGTRANGCGPHFKPSMRGSIGQHRQPSGEGYVKVERVGRFTIHRREGASSGPSSLGAMNTTPISPPYRSRPNIRHGANVRHTSSAIPGGYSSSKVSSPPSADRSSPGASGTGVYGRGKVEISPSGRVYYHRRTSRDKDFESGLRDRMREGEASSSGRLRKSRETSPNGNVPKQPREISAERTMGSRTSIDQRVRTIDKERVSSASEMARREEGQLGKDVGPIVGTKLEGEAVSCKVETSFQKVPSPELQERVKSAEKETCPNKPEKALDTVNVSSKQRDSQTRAHLTIDLPSTTGPGKPRDISSRVTSAEKEERRVAPASTSWQDAKKLKDDVLGKLLKIDDRMRHATAEIKKIKLKASAAKKEEEKRTAEKQSMQQLALKAQISSEVQSMKKYSTMMEKIYAENRERAKFSWACVDQDFPSEEFEKRVKDNDFPVSLGCEREDAMYTCPQELELYQRNQEFFKANYESFYLAVRSKLAEVELRENTLAHEYCERRDNYLRKVGYKVEEGYSVSMCTRKDRMKFIPGKSNLVNDDFSFRQSPRLKPSEPVIPARHDRFVMNWAQIPSMLITEDSKAASLCVSRNGLVEDPLEEDIESKRICTWDGIEKQIFLEKYIVFPKDFRKIASFLDNKTVHDVVRYYYKNKHRLRLSVLVSESQRKGGRVSPPRRVKLPPAAGKARRRVDSLLSSLDISFYYEGDADVCYNSDSD